MSKIFRLHTGANNTINDWTDIGSHLSDQLIDTIVDPAGATDKQKITSIPSPFASIDLVRTAFKWVNNKKQPEGNTIYHKLVSDCLDVAEIFFNINSLKSKVELLAWDAGISMVAGEMTIDINSDLGKLIHSHTPQHRLLGETLKLFLSQDARAYNFEGLQRLYLLNYKNGPSLMNIIGGTSPATLFFASSNKIDYVDISFGSHKVFSDTYCPLYNRSSDFIKYLFSLKGSISNFSRKFRDFDEYLTMIIGNTAISQVLRTEINAIEGIPNHYANNYQNVSVGAEGNMVEILGYPLKADNYHTDRIEANSAFVIEPSSTKNIPSPLPLVLPNAPFTQPLIYTIQAWVNGKNAPYYDSISFEQINTRTLPHQTAQYPYLTIDDLLEPYLIRTIYPIQKEKYFDGNLEIEAGDNRKGFILPLKRNFFHFFSIEDLQNPLHNGMPMFQLIQKSGTMVEATLRLPIRSVSSAKKKEGDIYTKHYVTFVRVYEESVTQSSIQQPDILNNKGIIVENQFALTIYPFLKRGTDDKADYRVMLIDRDINNLTKNNRYVLNFFKETVTEPFGTVATKIRSDKTLGDGATSVYYVLNKEFAYLQMGYGNIKGVVIPKLKTIPPGTAHFRFAVDFGTTNTHIEYSIDGGKPQPFEITEGEEQCATLHRPDLRTGDLGGSTYDASNILSIMRQEFMPLHIGREHEYRFPQRTVISNNKRLNYSTPVFSVADMSIFFNHEKYQSRNSENVFANLKWQQFSIDNKGGKQIQAFFEQLMLLIKNKVLLNGGDLNKTQLIWFYPTSMPIARRNALEQLWKIVFSEYINSLDPVSMSESIAPFYYYNKTKAVVATDKPVVSIDIGGGTTDVVVFRNDGKSNNVPVLFSSFKYAANAIFGDGYGSSPDSNGFVINYRSLIKELLQDNVLSDLASLEVKVEDTFNSADINTFYFSIASNWHVKEKKADISYQKMLSQNADVKIVFVFFYASIIYHVAQMMKANNLTAPTVILFSGNGSRVIKIIDQSIHFSSLASLTKIIFSDVFAQEVGNIKIEQENDPKEITAKGGLYNPIGLLGEKSVFVLKGIDIAEESKSLLYREINKPEIIDQVTKNVEKFIDFFFDLNQKINFQQTFEIPGSRLGAYKSMMKENIRQHLMSGIDEKLKEVDGNEDVEIEETLFFYPMIGIINELAFKNLSK